MKYFNFKDSWNISISKISIRTIKRVVSEVNNAYLNGLIHFSGYGLAGKSNKKDNWSSWTTLISIAYKIQKRTKKKDS